MWHRQNRSADLLTFAELVERLSTLPKGSRSIVAIAGPPASGKSHLAARLEDELNAQAPGRAAVVGMDGFHYDDQVLRAMGRLPWKGAPDTFDVGGLSSLLRRLRENAENAIAAPVFDREIEIARAGAQIIPRSVEIVLVEGNYLLVDEAPWGGLHDQFDLRVLVETPENILRRRLKARWRGLGLGETAVDAKLDDNDVPNGKYVIERSSNVDVVVLNED